MFSLRRRIVVPAPAVAPDAPLPPVHEVLEEIVKDYTKRSTILFAVLFGCQLFYLFLLKFLKHAFIDNFELQPMDQYHRFMAVIMLLFLVVVLYQIVFTNYDRAIIIILMATPFFVSPFFATEICKEAFFEDVSPFYKIYIFSHF